MPLEDYFLVEEAEAYSLENLVGKDGVNNPSAEFAIVSLYGGEEECLKDASLLNKQNYCKLHGCALYVPDKLLWTRVARSASRDHYTKLLAMLKVMESVEASHKWVVWEDGDTGVWEFDKSPREALDEVLAVSIDGRDIRHPPIGPWKLPRQIGSGELADPDHESDPSARRAKMDEVDITVSWPANTGCFFMRNSQFSREFLQRWWAYDLAGKENSRKKEFRWNDQGALIDMLWTDINIREKFAFYSYDDHPLAQRIRPDTQPSAWIIHAPGRSISQKYNVLVKFEKQRRQRDNDQSYWPTTTSCTISYLKTLILSGPSRMKAYEANAGHKHAGE